MTAPAIRTGPARFVWTAATITLLVLLALTARHLDFARVTLALRGVRGEWVAAAVVAYVATLPLWAVQWWMLAPPREHNSISRMLGVAAIYSSVSCTTMSLVGEASAVALLVSRIGLTRSEAISVVAMDQLLLAFSKLLVLAVAAMTIALPAWMRLAMLSFSGAVLLLTIVVLGVAWHAEALATPVARLLPRGASGYLGRASQALAPLRSARRSGIALALAVAKKALELLAILCVQQAFGVVIPLGGAVLLLGALGLATIPPLVPGNLGVFEATVVIVYAQMGLAPERALGIALILHLCFFAALALPGYPWLVRHATQAAVE